MPLPAVVQLHTRSCGPLDLTETSRSPTLSRKGTERGLRRGRTDNRQEATPCHSPCAWFPIGGLHDGVARRPPRGRRLRQGPGTTHCRQRGPGRGIAQFHGTFTARSQYSRGCVRAVQCWMRYAREPRAKHGDLTPTEVSQGAPGGTVLAPFCTKRLKLLHATEAHFRYLPPLLAFH